jgi:hypothetical protein
MTSLNFYSGRILVFNFLVESYLSEILHSLHALSGEGSGLWGAGKADSESNKKRAIRAAVSQHWAHVTIFSDSQAALALLADENCKHPLIHECQKIARTRPPYIFNLRWIPAHAGIDLHDVADCTAKQAGRKSRGQALYPFLGRKQNKQP